MTDSKGLAILAIYGLAKGKTQARIRNGKPGPVYLFCGESTYAVQAASQIGDLERFKHVWVQAIYRNGTWVYEIVKLRDKPQPKLWENYSDTSLSHL